MYIKLNNILDADTINNLINTLQVEFNKNHFIVDVVQVSKKRIKLIKHQCQFKINTNVLGYNYHARTGRRTSVPTWSERVQFNNIINNVLDSFDISADVKSTGFIIRIDKQSFTENDWLNNKPHYLNVNAILKCSLRSFICM